MASIKDVAKEAGVSFSTVSIVINGNAEARKISAETQNKVWEAVKRLNYQPNLSARSLRSQSTNKKTIALYWTTDFREVMCSRFLAGLNKYIKAQNLDYEVFVHTYINNELYKEEQNLLRPDFHGAIIATATPKDIAFLEKSSLNTPVVLYNRQSEAFSNVFVDDNVIGRKAAKAFAANGHKSVALVCAPYVFEGMRIRDTTFINECKKSRIDVIKYDIPVVSAESGYNFSKEIDFSAITGIYLPSDTLVVGLNRYCHENGINVPNDLSVLAIGNGIPDYSLYSVPSTSVVDIPMELMAENSLKLLERIFKNPGDSYPEHICLDSPLLIRESMKRIF